MRIMNANYLQEMKLLHVKEACSSRENPCEETNDKVGNLFHEEQRQRMHATPHKARAIELTTSTINPLLASNIILNRRNYWLLMAIHYCLPSPYIVQINLPKPQVLFFILLYESNEICNTCKYVLDYLLFQSVFINKSRK